jgi:hypothetical protein
MSHQSNSGSGKGALIGIVVGLAAVAGLILGPIMLASAFCAYG